jgi:hypothetical protein
MLEDEEPHVKPVIRMRADAPARYTVNAMFSEKCDAMVTESQVSKRGSPRSGFYAQAPANIRRHAVCSQKERADRVLEREEVAVRWIVVFVLGFLLGLAILGLLHGFALIEATILFPAILLLSTLWMLSSWGERSRSGE